MVLEGAGVCPFFASIKLSHILTANCTHRKKHRKVKDHKGLCIYLLHNTMQQITCRVDIYIYINIQLCTGYIFYATFIFFY